MFHKYGAKKTAGPGPNGGLIYYPSKLEAECAGMLQLLAMAKEIEGWETQYKIQMIPYDEGGQALDKRLWINHIVDFRVRKLDGNFVLLEAKGKETREYKAKKKWVQLWWLPRNPGYEYQLYTKNNRGIVLNPKASIATP